MSIAGYPTDPGDQGRDNDGRATPAEPPPDDWNAQFTAIVSGISGDMRWEVSGDDLDERAAAEGTEPARDEHRVDYPDIPRAPDSIWTNAVPDTASDRKVRRDLRRQERAEALAAFEQAKQEREAAHAADTEHYDPPPPPPLPKLRRSTIGAIALIIVGVVLIVFPTVLPASLDLIVTLGLLAIVAGGAVLVAALRRGARQRGWDDGAEV